MGSSQSTTKQAVVSPGAVLPNGVAPVFMAPNTIVDKIKGLGDVIGFFNDNDTESLAKFVDVYNQQVATKDKIELGPELKNLMMGFHNQLLTVIDSQFITATAQEKQQVLKSKLKDNKQLNEMLGMYYNEKLKAIEARVLGDEAVRSNPQLIETVKAILNNVKSLKVKYKFFEYKYVQLNIFMIVFIQFVYNSMTKFIVDVIAYNTARDAIRQEMTQKIFAATRDIMSASDLQIRPEDSDAITKMITNLQEKVKNDQVEIQEMSAKLKTDSMSDLLNFVLKSDESLATHIMESVDKFKQTQGVKINQNNNQGNPNKPWQNNPNKPWQNKPWQQNPQLNNQQLQQGGFIRDLSMLPQAFYAL